MVSSFLLYDSDEPLDDQIQKCFPQNAKYAGFNLLLLAPSTMCAPPTQVSDLDARLDLCYEAALVTNGSACGPITSRPLGTKECSCGGFSNGVDGKGGGEWPKVKRGLRDFENLISQATQTSDKHADEAELVNHLFELLL